MGLASRLLKGRADMLRTHYLDTALTMRKETVSTVRPARGPASAETTSAAEKAAKNQVLDICRS